MKKRNIIGICAVTAVLATAFVCSLFPSAADDEFTISTVAYPSDIAVSPDGSMPKEYPFSLQIRMDNIPEGGYDSTYQKDIVGGLSAVQFAVEFDDSVITFDADGDNEVDGYCEEGELSDNGAYELEQSQGSIDPSGSNLTVSVVDNHLNISWSTGLYLKDSEYYLNGSGILASIEGTIDTDALYKKEYAFKIVPAKTYTPTGEETEIFDFSVWVDDDSYNFKKYAPSVVNGFLPGDGSAVAYGDVDLDGKSCDITDVVLLGKHISGKLTLSETSDYYKNANCYLKGDGADVINVDDLKTIIDKMLGVAVTLPVM